MLRLTTILGPFLLGHAGLVDGVHRDEQRDAVALRDRLTGGGGCSRCGYRAGGD